MNPINYATGLVVELGYAQQDGDKLREAAVREQLAWVSGELEKVDPGRLSEGLRAMLTEAKTATADALATKAKRATKTAE
ncbi:hypothetical protein [Streptomyces collinus]